MRGSDSFDSLAIDEAAGFMALGHIFMCFVVDHKPKQG